MGESRGADLSRHPRESEDPACFANAEEKKKRDSRFRGNDETGSSTSLFPESRYFAGA
jgi:hypothetical protein